jgi:hypothetical protein
LAVSPVFTNWDRGLTTFLDAAVWLCIEFFITFLDLNLGLHLRLRYGKLLWLRMMELIVWCVWNSIGGLGLLFCLGWL